MHKGDLSAAADRFKYAVELQPNLAKPHLLLAKISEKENDKAAAIRYYEEYLAILPRAPDAARVRARVAELKKQLQP
jgi:predicted TPR repeat methyltransferase